MFAQRITVLLFLAGLMLLSATGVVSAGHEGTTEKTETGTVVGRIMIKGDGPLSWGQVMFYDIVSGPPPMADRYERIPDISRDIDADGGFKVELPVGKYYMGAVKRMSGERFGPPREGDYLYRSVDEKGPKTYRVEAGKVLDLGEISEAVKLKAEDISKGIVRTAMEGAIVDRDGRPVEGAVVAAFPDISVGRRPLFISDKSDRNGKYILRVTQGTYYLRVNNQPGGGPPAPGTIVGYYGEGQPVAVVIKDGEIKKGIDFRVIRFRGRGPSGMGPVR